MEQTSGVDNFRLYIKLIGKIKSQIDKADTLNSALQTGLKCIADELVTDCAILWYADEDGTELRPYYWIGAHDYTMSLRHPGEDLVGRVFSENRPISILDYHEGDDPVSDNDMRDLNISSLICIPFTNGDTTVGCIQLVRGNGAHFDSEVIDICQIMELIISMTIEDSGLFDTPHPLGKRLISLSGLKKSFQSGEETTNVLKGVSLDVFEGEFLVILGESGCGKSTLLNIIGGMNQADSGTYLYDGQDLSQASSNALTDFRRDNVGFIFQDYHLMPNLTAKQNIDFIGELVKDPMDSGELLKAVNLYAKKDNYPSQLSGGQKQRISIARALVKKPRLILADEPTAALDYTTSIEILTLLSDVIRHNTTLVMVTHNEEIARMADRIVRLRDGRVYEVTVNRHPVDASQLVW